MTYTVFTDINVYTIITYLFNFVSQLPDYLSGPSDLPGTVFFNSSRGNELGSEQIELVDFVKMLVNINCYSIYCM